MSDNSKVTATHLRRLALVYVRQSTTAQVEYNRESTERQYRLAERAAQLPAFSANNARLHVHEKGRQTRAGARAPGGAKGQTGY